MYGVVGGESGWGTSRLTWWPEGETPRKAKSCWQGGREPEFKGSVSSLLQFYCCSLSRQFYCCSLSWQIYCWSLGTQIHCWSLSTQIYCCSLSTQIYCWSLPTQIDCCSLSTQIDCCSLSTQIDCCSLSTQIDCCSLSRQMYTRMSGGSYCRRFRTGLSTWCPLSVLRWFLSVRLKTVFVRLGVFLKSVICSPGCSFF